VGKVGLVEQSRPALVWPVDVVLGFGGGVVFSGRWKTFALGHHLLVGDRLVFRFKLGTLEATVRIFDANDACRIYPLSAQEE
jgi:hypothetical protein